MKTLVYSLTEQRWFQVLYMLPDDPEYFACVWDDQIQDHFAILTSSVDKIQYEPESAAAPQSASGEQS